MENKSISLYAGCGNFQRIEKIRLEVGTIVKSYSGFMLDTECAIIENLEYFDRAVTLSDYEPRFLNVQHPRPLSKKFGIGTYYYDDLRKADPAEIKKYIELANEADIKRFNQAEQKKKDDIGERERLTKVYDYLIKAADHKKGDFGAAKDNIRTELKKEFPGVKFSVASDHYDCINIRWSDGPTVSRVEKITGKYEDHETDITGDYRDPAPSNFNKVFGGSKYVFENREMTDSTRLKFETWAQNEYDKGHQWGALDVKNLAYRLFVHYDIPASFEIIKTEDACGGIEDIFAVKEINDFQPVAITKVQIIDYSERAIAVIGDTKPIKDILKGAGGRFNFALTVDNSRVCGWIFPKTQKETISNLLSI